MPDYKFRDGVITSQGSRVELDALISEFRSDMIRTQGHGGKWAALAAGLLHERDQRIAAERDERRGVPEREPDVDTPTWVRETPVCETTRKRRFKSKTSALASNRSNGQRLRAYQCDDCHDYHVAKNGR